MASEVNQSQKQLQIVIAEMKDEKTRMESIKAAYNADKRALMDRNELLEQ